MKTLTFYAQSIITETKKKGFVPMMRDVIIEEAIESLRQEGLKFSVDTLCDKLKISKKPFTNIFPIRKHWPPLHMKSIFLTPPSRILCLYQIINLKPCQIVTEYMQQTAKSAWKSQIHALSFTVSISLTETNSSTVLTRT